MSKQGNRVMLSAWVDPVLRDYAREAAREAGVPFSEFIERAVQQHVSRVSAHRAAVAAARAWDGPAFGMSDGEAERVAK